MFKNVDYSHYFGLVSYQEECVENPMSIPYTTLPYEVKNGIWQLKKIIIISTWLNYWNF